MSARHVAKREEKRGLGQRRARGQEGFVLVLVLGLLMIFAFVGLALFAYTNTTAQATSSLAKASDTTHEIDGALDTAVSQIRPNPELDASGNPVSCLDTNTPNHNSSDLFTNVFAAKNAAGTAAFPDVISVGCKNNGSLSTAKRDITITVCGEGGSATSSCPPSSASDGRLLGQARVVFVDTAATGFGPSAVPGYTINVCDWQVGTAVSATLNSC